MHDLGIHDMNLDSPPLVTGIKFVARFEFSEFDLNGEKPA